MDIKLTGKLVKTYRIPAPHHRLKAPSVNEKGDSGPGRTARHACRRQGRQAHQR